MVLQYYAQEEKACSSGCAISLSPKQWRQVHGHSVQQAMIAKDACHTQSSVQCEKAPDDNLAVPKMQRWKNQRVGPASAPATPTTSSQDGVV